MKKLLHRIVLLTALSGLLVGCSAGTTFRTYGGEALSSMQVAVIQGAQFLRQDWLNRYIDSVRFAQVDDVPVESNVRYSSVEVTPGFHDINVYFYWDMGSARGLAPALVSYAASRETLSRTLRFNARAGEVYTVRAQPIFHPGPREITNLSHVDFWVEDQRGNEIVTREEGRYSPDLGTN